MEWLSLPFHNKSNIPEWLDFAVPVVEDAQLSTASITDQFTNLQAASLLGDDYEPVDLDYSKVTGSALRNGVDLKTVYQRPFVNFWMTLKDGRSVDDALRSAAARIRELVETDIERVVDHTTIEKFANSHRIAGYRRVLFGPVNCALCIVASTQRYHKRRLKPIHPHCDCKVAPVLSFEAGDDQILDQDLLDQIHSDVQKQFGQSDKSARKIDYRKILVEKTHGEYGPTMTYRGYDFTSVSDLS